MPSAETVPGVQQWRDAHPDTQIPDGHVFVQPWPAGLGDNRRDHTYFYQYKADRARRTLRGIDTQVTKAENAVAGRNPVKRNRYVRLTRLGPFSACLGKHRPRHHRLIAVWGPTAQPRSSPRLRS